MSGSQAGEWGALLCSFCQLPWCKHSHHSQLQATNPGSLTKELGRNMHREQSALMSFELFKSTTDKCFYIYGWMEVGKKLGNYFTYYLPLHLIKVAAPGLNNTVTLCKVFNLTASLMSFM